MHLTFVLLALKIALSGADPPPLLSPAYDIIIVGGGTAGSIIASKLALSDTKNRGRILVLERGGPLSALVGGTDFPPYSNDKTVFDVPGEYPNLPFHPKADPYRLDTLSPPFWTFQGIGLGGNSLFNGMLWQRLPDIYFDNKFPDGWKAEDIAKHYESLESRLRITRFPSMDGIHYLDEASQINENILDSMGSHEVHPSKINYTDGFGIPPVAVTKDGFRDGPVQLYLKDLLDENGVSKRENLEIVYFAQVNEIIFSDDGKTATGVEFIQYASLEDSNEQLNGVQKTAELSLDSDVVTGHVILTAGALATPRILMLSGVENNGLGQLVDHIGASLVVQNNGTIPYKAFFYDDYDSNSKETSQYINANTGPYMQYQPVLMHQKAFDSEIPNVEIFFNPHGEGTQDGTFAKSDMFSVFVGLIDPVSTGTFVLNENGDLTFPIGTYYGDNKDVELHTDALIFILETIKKDPNLKVVLGPGGIGDENLDPTSRDDVKSYLFGEVANSDNSIHKAKLIMNHYSSSCPLRIDDSLACVDPVDLLVKGTNNVHVADASLLPDSPPGHPVATIMAIAENAADIFVSFIPGKVADTQNAGHTGPSSGVIIMVVMLCVFLFILAVYLFYRLFWVRLRVQLEKRQALDISDTASSGYVNMSLVENKSGGDNI